MIGQAQTGTGKTAAFGLPLMQHIDPDQRRDSGDRPDSDPRALHPGHSGAALLRRAPRHQRRRRLRRHLGPRPGGPGPSNAHVVVATVGRMKDLISRGSLVLTSARYVVLDEADEMLDLGLPRGRREDPAHVPERAPDDALQRDDAAADRAARRDLHVRPGDDLDHPQEADRRCDRAGLRRGRRQATRPTADRGPEGGGAGAGNRLLPDEDRHRPPRQASARRRASPPRHCTAT